MKFAKDTRGIERYIAFDIHKEYVLVGGQNARQEWVMQPRRVGIEKLREWTAANLRKDSLFWGGLLPLGLTLLLGWRGWRAAALGLLTTLGVLTLAKNRLGSVTGDVFGLLVEVVEIVGLLTFLL